MSELENQSAVDQLAHPALILLAARPDLFAQQGSISATWRRRNNQTFGPYYRLRYRDGESSRSLYLGRSSPLVDRVRHVLQTLQAPLRQRRAFDQLYRRVREALRADRRQVDAHLRSLGLHLKGFEVRGWRTSPLRTLTRPARKGQIASASMQIKPPKLKPFRVPRVRQGTVPIFAPAKMGLSPSALPSSLFRNLSAKMALPSSSLLRGLRFIPKGRAATWMRQNRPKIPRRPKDRLQAVLDARDRAAYTPRQ